MQFVFKEATLVVNPDLYEEFDLLTSIKNETNEYPKEVDLTNFSLKAGKAILKLITLTNLLKPNKVLKKFDISMITKILELSNYLMIKLNNKFIKYISDYIYKLFLQVFKIEYIRGHNCALATQLSKLVVIRIRKIFGIKDKDLYLNEKRDQNY